MALHRVQARLRFPASSGMAAWCHAQMDVRHGQAVHINEGLANEEAKRNEIIDDGDEQVFACDLPLMDEAHAVDAFNTLTAASVLAQATEWSITHHTCRHDETPPQPCAVVSREVGP